MGLLARQTINCERISVGQLAGAGGGGGGGCRVCRRRARGILPRLFFIRILARAVSRLFLILHRGRECFTLRPRPSRLPPPCSTPFPRPRTRCSSYESRGIAPRNEFTILIWRAALAIYYLHGVGEKKTGDEASAAVEGGRTTAGGWELVEGWGPGSPRGRRDNSRGSKIYRIYMRAPR